MVIKIRYFIYVQRIFKNICVCIYNIYVYIYISWLPQWLRGKESTCQCMRHTRCGFDPWVRKTPWRRAWQPTVFLLGKSYGQRSPVGYIPWDHKELDMTEATEHTYICVYVYMYIYRQTYTQTHKLKKYIPKKWIIASSNMLKFVSFLLYLNFLSFSFLYGFFIKELFLNFI